MGKTKSKSLNTEDVNILMAVDPGTNYLGWAVFKLEKKLAIHVGSGCISVKSKQDNWVERIDNALNLLKSAIKLIRPSILLIEQPIIFGAGRGSAALNSGSVHKLTACVFQLKGMISQLSPSCCVQLIPVRQWKGNVPKRVTELRVQKYWNIQSQSLDEIDAIGLADYYIRNILKLKPHRKVK